MAKEHRVDMLLLLMLTSVCKADLVQFDVVVSSGRPFKVTKTSMAVCGAECKVDDKCKGFIYNSSERICHWMEETCQESHQMYVKTNHPIGKSGNNITTRKSDLYSYLSNISP